MKPMAHSSGVRNSTEPPHIVAIHENTLTTVGTAITMLETAKKACVSSDMPTVYMWCAQTNMTMAMIASRANTMPREPNTGLRLKVAITWLMIPKAGKIMM